MPDNVTVLETRDADRRLLMKLQYRLLGTIPSPVTPMPQSEDRKMTMVFALAPMAFVFLYLIVLNLILFR